MPTESLTGHRHIRSLDRLPCNKSRCPLRNPRCYRIARQQKRREILTGAVGITDAERGIVVVDRNKRRRRICQWIFWNRRASRCATSRRDQPDYQTTSFSVEVEFTENFDEQSDDPVSIDARKLIWPA